MGRTEGSVGSLVLIDMDSRFIPRFWVEVIQPSSSHCGYRICNSRVQPSLEFDHYGLRIRVPGVRDEVSEVVEVVVNCPSALEVADPFQLVGCRTI